MPSRTYRYWIADRFSEEEIARDSSLFDFPHGPVPEEIDEERDLPENSSLIGDGIGEKSCCAVLPPVEIFSCDKAHMS